MAHVSRIDRQLIVDDHTPEVVYEASSWQAAQVVDYVLGLVEVLLGLRFVFKLFAANPSAGFVNFLYGITNPLMAPFRAIFGSTTEQGATFEWSVLVAMVVYALVALAIVRLIEIASERSQPAL